jgi:hypothetical protein
MQLQPYLFSYYPVYIHYIDIKIIFLFFCLKNISNTVATVFTGITLPKLNLDFKPTGLMIGWILSVIVFIVVIELIQKKYYRDIYHFNISNNLSIYINL